MAGQPEFDSDGLPTSLGEVFQDGGTLTPDETKVVDQAVPPPETKPNTDPFHILGAGLNMQVGGLKQNYYNLGLMTRTDLTDEQEIDLLQKSTKSNFGDLTEEELKAAPWWLRAGVDAEGLGVSLGHTFGVGAATGGAAALSSAPLAAGLSGIPVVGAPAAGVVEGFSYAGGFTVGSLTAIGTQSAGQMYGDLRLKGVSKQTATTIAGAYGMFSAGIGSIGLGTVQKLGGSAANVGLRQSLVPLATKAGYNVASPAAKKVQAQLLTRLGIAFAQNVAVGTTAGEGQILLDHAAKAAAGYVEKHDFSSYTSWDDTKQDMQSKFLQLLGANVLISAGVAGGGYAAGKVKVTTEQVLTPETVANLEKQLKGQSAAEIVRRVEQAVNDKPFPHEENQGQSVVVTEDGRTLRYDADKQATSTKDAEGGTTLSLGVSVTEDGDVQPVVETNGGQAPTAEQSQAAKDALEGTPIGKAIKNSPEEVQQALNDIMAPEEDQFAPPDAPGQAMEAVTDYPQELTPQETQSRVNQIAADTRLLTVEQRKLEAQFDRKEKLGHSTDATLKKLDAVLNSKEELNLERDMLENGLMSREDVAASQGKQRMSALASVMNKLQKANDKLITQKDKYESRVLDSRKTGANVERRNIQTMQKKLQQYVNAATKDRDIRKELKTMVAGVTTPEQFKKTGNDIRDRLIELEKKKVDALDKSMREEIIDKIDGMVKRGAKVKMQSGHPVSSLDADTVASMQKLRAYLQDQTLPKKKQQDLAGRDIVEFHKKTLDPSDPNSTSYEELLQSGQAHLIPADEYQDYQLATMAHNIKKQSLLELNVTKGNIGQMIADAKANVAAKQDVLRQQREAENQIAEKATGADHHVLIEGNAPPATVAKQKAEGLTAKILSWPNLMDFVSWGDQSHALSELMDVTPAKRTSIVNKEVVKGGLRQAMQEVLTNSGSKQTWLQYTNDASTDEYEFRYPRSDGRMGTARYTRAQMIRIHGWMQDADLHDTMRNSEKGNGWTLRGDTAPGTSFEELMYSVMTPQDMKVSWGFIDFFSKYGTERINPHYREKYGVDLPMKENYTPVSRAVHRVEVGQKRQQMFSSLLPGAAKSRVNSIRRLKPDNAFEAMDDHIDDWEHFIAYDNIFGTMQNVFKRNENVRNAIIDRHGRGTMQVIDNFIDRFVDNTPMGQDTLFGAALRGSMARAVLPWRAPVQILQQLSAGTAMWKEHSLPEIAAGFGAMAKDLKGTRKAFLESPILRHRYEGGASVDLHNAFNQAGILETAISWATGIDNVLTPEQHNALLRLGFEGIRRGDAATVQIFGGAVYHAEMARGKTPLEAMITVERLAESTQQGDSVDQIPDIYAANPVLYTLVGQFHLQPLQLYAHEVQALREFASNPSLKNAMVLGKQTALLWVLPGLFFGTVQNAPSLYMPPNDNPDVQAQAITAIASEGVLGPTNGLPLVGDIVEAAWMSAMKPAIGVDMKYRAHISNTSVAERAEAVFEMFHAWEKVFKAEDDTKLPTLKDMMKDPVEDEFKAIFKTARTIGPLTGFPVQAINAPAGVVNALRHDDWIGAMFAIGGWSPGSIQPRYKAEDALALPKPDQQSGQSAVDWVREGILRQEQPEDTQQQANDSIMEGVMNGIVNTEDPTGD